MKSCTAVLLAVSAFVLGACSSGSSPSSAAPASSAPAIFASRVPGTLAIYADASLKAALDKVKTTYEAAHAGSTLAITTDSSSALETQIEQGAPADVFLAADTTSPQKLVDAGLVTGSPTKLADNLLAVIVPTANPAGVQTPADLARTGVKVIAAADSVALTKDVAKLVANLATQAGYPPKFVKNYRANVVSREADVAAVVSKVGSGAGDAGVVYATDAKNATTVTTIPVPDAANVPVTYAGVGLKASPNASAATAFLTWLAGSDGQAILASFGFLPPS